MEEEPDSDDERERMAHALHPPKKPRVYKSLGNLNAEPEEFDVNEKTDSQFMSMAEFKEADPQAVPEHPRLQGTRPDYRGAKQDMRSSARQAPLEEERFFNKLKQNASVYGACGGIRYLDTINMIIMESEEFSNLEIDLVNMNPVQHPWKYANMLKERYYTNNLAGNMGDLVSAMEEVRMHALTGAEISVSEIMEKMKTQSVTFVCEKTLVQCANSFPVTEIKVTMFTYQLSSLSADWCICHFFGQKNAPNQHGVQDDDLKWIGYLFLNEAQLRKYLAE